MPARSPTRRAALNSKAAYRSRLPYKVVVGDEPERIYGEWWRRDAEVWAVRDYYRVEDEEGGRFWVFRRGDGVESDTSDLTWWMHGVFA